MTVERAIRVGIVGGGISGLTTAMHLADAGAEVTVLEADERVGGQIHSRSLSGHDLDVGAEALHTAAPEVPALLGRLQLEGEVVEARGGATWLAGPRGLRALPEGVGPAGPTRIWPVATSGILSPAGLLRAALEPLMPDSRPEGDTAVGDYLAGRFGHEVSERLVDPLLGNLHAGDIHRLSMRAATPMLDRAARRHRSLVLGRRGTGGGPPLSFVTVQGGLRRITEALAADDRITVRRSSPVERVERRPGGYRLHGPAGEATEVDAVVLAVPAAVAARLTAPLDPVAGELLSGIVTASVATVVVGYRRDDIARHERFAGTGLLLPSSSEHLLKAATFLSSKWPHLATAEPFLVRLSAGRAGDDRLGQLDDAELLTRLQADLADVTGLDASPVTAPATSLLQRWDHTMPQLEVGHTERITEVRRRLADGHRIALAGAPYDGIGISSCLRSARAAADAVLGPDDHREAAA